MISKLQTPQIRFTGFNEDWEKSTLSEVADIYDGTHQTPHYTNSGVMFLSVENINTLVSKKCISEADFKRDFKNFPEKNDVLMTRIGDVGTANIVTSSDPLAYYVSLALLKPKNIVPTYLKIAIASDFVQRDIWRRTLHIAFPKKINKNEITKVEIFTPPLQVEQTAIGNLFQNIDQTIALQRRKHEQTQTLKKSLLSKMFPKKGQKQPEIRLKGFSGNWVESKFFDNIESIIDFRGRTPKKIGLEWSEKGYLALSALNVKNGYIDFNLDKHFGNEELYQKWMGGKELVAGQVLFTTEAPMGNVAQVPDNKGYILSQRTIAFNIRKDLLTDDFLAILLKSPVTFNMLESMSSGGTAKGVSQKSLANLQVVTPQQLEEQTAIGQFFKQLDDTLSLQAKQLKTLENLKQALLAKMFV